MRRIILFLQSTLVLTRNESVVLLWLSGLVLFGSIGRTILPESSLHAHVPAQVLLAMLDSADWKPKIADSVASASPHSKSSPGVPPVNAAIHVNSATAAQLETIPGIGPATARSIVEYRLRRQFTSVEDLLDIKGIGKKKLERMRPFITVP